MSENLTPKQRLAAARIASGDQIKVIAEELTIDRSTLTRWQKLDGFRELVRTHREGLMPETVTAEATLTAALSATRKDGSPAWEHRIAAAKALLSTPIASDPAREQAARAERIFINGDSE